MAAKKKAKEVKSIKAWMPLGTDRLIVLKSPAPVANGRMEAFAVRKHGAKYWPEEGLVRVEIRVIRKGK